MKGITGAYQQLMACLLGAHENKNSTGEYIRSHWEDYADRTRKFGIDYPAVWNQALTALGGRIPAIQEYACYDEPLKAMLSEMLTPNFVHRMGMPAIERLIADLVRDSWAMWGFYAYGRSTFLMRRDLTRMLLETDLSVEWDAFRLPFPFFYLRFEDVPVEITNEDGTHYQLDGCYLTEMPERVMRADTADILDGRLKPSVERLPGPWVHFMFVSKPSQEVIGGANTMFLYCKRGQPNEPLNEAFLQREFDEIHAEEWKPVRRVALGDLHQLVKLAVNSVLYINSIQADVEHVSNQARRDLLQSVEEKKVPRRERDRITNRERVGTLLDYHDVGRRIVLPQPHGDPGEWVGTKVRQLRYRHIVRGFWRRQHHGPKHSLVKTIWVLPHWRGADVGKLVARTYDVGKPEDSAEGTV